MRKSLQPHVSRLQPYVLQVPLFANPASFARPPGQRIWLDEARPMSSVRCVRALHCVSPYCVSHMLHHAVHHTAHQAVRHLAGEARGGAAGAAVVHLLRGVPRRHRARPQDQLPR